MYNPHSVFLQHMKALKQEDALVVFSGGQDSTTCLYWALQTFGGVRALCFSYGQTHVAEVKVARQLCQQAGVPIEVMDVAFISTLSRNALTDPSLTMDKAKPEDGPPNTFVPGRNLFFMSIAAVHARELGIRHIVTGVSQTDYSGYPDCRDNFVKSLNVTLNMAMEADFVLHTPLMWLDKAGVWALSDTLGVLDIIRTQTLTCYNGLIGDGCGHCPACHLRREGLQTYLQHKQQETL